MNAISLLINGERTQASQGATFERRNPLDGSVATRAPAASVASREDIARTRRRAGSSACRPLGPLPTDGATCCARAGLRGDSLRSHPQAQRAPASRLTPLRLDAAVGSHRQSVPARVVVGTRNLTRVGI